MRHAPANRSIMDFVERNCNRHGLKNAQTNGASPSHGQFIVNWMRQ
jgi:hypothetical protein